MYFETFFLINFHNDNFNNDTLIEPELSIYFYLHHNRFPNLKSIKIFLFAAKSMAKNSKGDSSNDPKASTDSSTTIEDDDSKGQ